MSHHGFQASKSSATRNKNGATRDKPRIPESFESQQARDHAVELLESYEKLSWVSFNREETIAQTRLYLRKIIAGFNPPPAEQTYWKKDFTPHPIEEEQQQQTSKKGKQRVRFAYFDGKTFVDAPIQANAPRHRKERPKPAATAESSTGVSSSNKRQHTSEMDTK